MKYIKLTCVWDKYYVEVQKWRIEEAKRREQLAEAESGKISK